MQLNKASKKTSKSAEKALVAGSEKIASPEAPKTRVARSSRAKKSEGVEMTSGKNLHKPATPAISAANAQTETTEKIALPVEAKPITAAAAKGAAQADIGRLAYSYWLERGGAHGFAEQDWLRAERELNSR